MSSCELPNSNASPDEIRGLLRSARTIAVVGLSDKLDRDSYGVSAYLQRQGYRIIPVNPGVQQVLGEKSYASLKEVPERVDIVDIFRKPDAIPAIVDEAIAIGAKAVWMQLGLAHNAAAEKARDAGLAVIMNKCIKIEHARL